MSPFFTSLKSAGEPVITESIKLFTFGAKGATPALIISSPIFSGILIISRDSFDLITSTTSTDLETKMLFICI